METSSHRFVRLSALAPNTFGSILQRLKLSRLRFQGRLGVSSKLARASLINWQTGGRVAWRHIFPESGAAQH